MNQVKARGLLRHRYWGTYSAVIVLAFDTPEAARDALKVLGAPWVAISAKTFVLSWTGETEALEQCKERLGTFGADVSKIDSVAHSIDYGEPFEVTIPIVAPAEQESLF
ncbi:MAG TPA: hypothetical protein VF819_10610 [Nitrospira sp.]